MQSLRSIHPLVINVDPLAEFSYLCFHGIGRWKFHLRPRVQLGFRNEADDDNKALQYPESHVDVHQNSAKGQIKTL